MRGRLLLTWGAEYSKTKEEKRSGSIEFGCRTMHTANPAQIES